MKGVVLAAGKATRMREVSLGLPKILLPLGQGTIGDNVLQGLKQAGASEVLIVVKHMEEQIRERFSDGSSLGLSIGYVRQDKPLGTGHAASLARQFAAEEPFFILSYGDIATPPENYAKLLADFSKHSPEASMSVHRVQDPSKGAAVYLQNGYLKSLLEKPPPGAASSQLDNAGVYVFTPRIFQMLDQVGLSPRKEYELTDALTLLVHNRYRVRAFEFGGFWSNVSSPEDLLEVNRLVIDRLSAAKSPPLPRTLPGVELSPLSVLHPQARLGRCSIGPYTLVDKGAQVMDGASVANSLICGNAVVGKDATLNHVMVRPECVVKAAAVHTGSRDNVVILPDEA